MMQKDIRARREAMGWSEREFASLADVTIRTLKNAEAGRIVSAALLALIGVALDRIEKMPRPPALAVKAAGKPRGFQTMSKERCVAIAQVGGRAAHQMKRAHEFTSEEARTAGSKGGIAVSRNREHMSAIGRIGGATRSQRLAGQLSLDAESVLRAVCQAPVRKSDVTAGIRMVLIAKRLAKVAELEGTAADGGKKVPHIVPTEAGRKRVQG